MTGSLAKQPETGRFTAATFLIFSPIRQVSPPNRIWQLGLGSRANHVFDIVTGGSANIRKSALLESLHSFKVQKQSDTNRTDPIRLAESEHKEPRSSSGAKQSQPPGPSLLESHPNTNP